MEQDSGPLIGLWRNILFWLIINDLLDFDYSSSISEPGQSGLSQRRTPHTHVNDSSSDIWGKPQSPDPCIIRMMVLSSSSLSYCVHVLILLCIWCIFVLASVSQPEGPNPWGNASFLQSLLGIISYWKCWCSLQLNVCMWENFILNTTHIVILGKKLLWVEFSKKYGKKKVVDIRDTKGWETLV